MRAVRGADGGAALAANLDGGPDGAPLKCLHAHAAAALGSPPYAFGELVLERAGARARGKLLRMSVNELSLRLAREDWRGGERTVERVLADPRRAPVARTVMAELERELRRRLGQTYTLDDARARLRRCRSLGPRRRTARRAGRRLGAGQRVRRRRLRAGGPQRPRLDSGLSTQPPLPPPSPTTS